MNNLLLSAAIGDISGMPYEFGESALIAQSYICDSKPKFALVY